MNEWNSFDDFIKALINNESEDNNITAESFNGMNLKNLQNNKPELWKSFLDFLSNESNKLGHSPILEGDLQKLDYSNPLLSTVFGYITQKADFNSENLPINKIQEIITGQQLKVDLSKPSGFINSDGTDTNSYFWNESMSKLMAKYLNTLFGGIALDKEGNVIIAIDDIKNADAGYLFGYQNLPDENEWVKPWINIDEQKYQEVRGNDAINAVLSNDNNLQFTHSQDIHKQRLTKDANGNWTKGHENKWIRLLMPKYLRRVEIEDLNRNFWVIGQVISAVCAYLFGDNGLGGLLKDMINELMELWQNVIYLWAALAALASKPPKTHELHKEVVMLPNNELQPYIKFDDFTRDTKKLLDLPHSNEIEKAEIVNKILPKLTYLKDTYTDNNIFTLICVRDKNYTHNYYGRECYIGIYSVKYNEEEQPQEQIEIFTNYIDIDLIADFSSDLNTPCLLNHISQDIGAIKESDLSELNYIYYYPFYNLGSNLSLRLEDYHALLRTKINIVVNEDLSDYQITFNLYDVAYILKQLNNISLDDNIDYNTIEESALIRTLKKTKNNNSITMTEINKTERTTEVSEITVQLGCYLGELITCLPSLKDPPKFELAPQRKTGVPFYYPQYKLIDLIFSKSENFVAEDEYNNIVSEEDGQVLTKAQRYVLDKQAYTLLQDTQNILDIMNLAHLNKSLIDGGGTLSFLIMSHACGMLMGNQKDQQTANNKCLTVLAEDLEGDNLLENFYTKGVMTNDIVDTLTEYSSTGLLSTYGSSKLFKSKTMTDSNGTDCFGHYSLDELKEPNGTIKYYGIVPQGTRSFVDTTQYCAAIIPDNSMRGKYIANGSGIEKGGSLAFQSGQYVYSFPDYIDYSSNAMAFTNGTASGQTISSDILYTKNGDALSEGNRDRSANWLIKRMTYCYTDVTNPQVTQDCINNYCIQIGEKNMVITKVAVCYFAPPEQLESDANGVKKIQKGQMAYKVYDRYENVSDTDKGSINDIVGRWNIARENYQNAAVEEKHSAAFKATVRKTDIDKKYMWAYYYPYDSNVEEFPVSSTNTPNAYLYREFEKLVTDSDTTKALYQIPKTTNTSQIKDFEKMLFDDPMKMGGVVDNE